MLNVSVDTSQLDPMRRFVGAFQGQLPFATSVAINNTARDVQQAFKATTSTAFKNPTAFTKNAFRYTKSTKANLVATIAPQPNRPYFDPQTFGGTRRWKAYEGFIRGLANDQPTNTLPPGKLVPTSLAVNAAGNPKRRLFAEIQSKLSSTDRGGYFIGTPKGGGTPGVWRRSRERLFPYFIVVDEPQYDRRFPMERVGNQTVSQHFPTHLSNALDRAIKTAK
jgi:hypothetical protein